MPVQEDFDNVMKEYPESSKAMDLIAEHRLRSLHASEAWRSKQDALHEAKMASLGAKIEHVLEVSLVVSCMGSDQGQIYCG